MIIARHGTFCDENSKKFLIGDCGVQLTHGINRN